MRLLADIQFGDGSIRRCTGTVKGGVRNESPGKGVPWESEAEIRRHIAANEGLKLIRIIRH